MSRRTYSRNAFETQLDGGISDAAATINLDSTSGLTHPLYLVIDPSNVSKREYIKAAGITGNQLTGVTRGLAGSAAAGQAHDTGTTVRAVPVHQWLEDIFDDIEDLEAADTAHFGGTDTTDHPEATISVRGFMSGADKTKLDGIAAGAKADHGALTGLADDDHAGYLPLSGVRQMTGDLDMGGQSITDVVNVDGIDVATLGAQAFRGDHSGEYNALTNKTTPVGADLFSIEDSANSFAKRKLSYTNLVAALAGTGFVFKETVRFLASDSFTKADYAGLKAIRVRLVGGGGGGGGSQITGAGVGSFGNGGNGGSYAEAWILAADLAATEAVTVGTGGAGNSGATGDDGTDSVFDTISGEVRAKGGKGGGVSAASAGFGVGTPVDNDASTGDLTIHGGQDTSGFKLAAGAAGFGGAGGSSQFAPPRNMRTNATNGQDGHDYGGGGSGTFNDASQGTARTGGAGADGIVIVDVFI